MDPLSGASRGLDRESLSLYVHLPFCDVRCPYCHFYCFVPADRSQPLRMVRALAHELSLVEGADGPSPPLASVYFGGGTPSALPDDARAEICRWLGDTLRPRLIDGAEVTLELNPESTTGAVLDDWVAAGVNRLSLGVQSMDDGVLRFLGRLNTPASNRRALDLACSRVHEVSADLILATPPDRWATTRDSLASVTGWPITHVSAYLLEIHDDTRFGRDHRAGRLVPTPDAQQAALYLRAADWLQGRGFAAYELSNFALPGSEARHNQRYWQRLPYRGLGPSAHSFRDERRGWNPPDIGRWMEAVEAGRSPEEGHEILGPGEIEDERILLGLRTREGVPLAWLRGREDRLPPLAAAGLLERRGERLRATAEGWLVLDQMVAQLLR